jgi:hypothetical protein
VIRHQVEHRAKEKSTLAVSQHMVEQLVERVSHRSSERAVEHVMEKTGERTLEHWGGKVVERSIMEQAGETLGEHALERWTIASSERILERTSEATLERTGKKSSQRWLEHVVSSGRPSVSASHHITARIGRGLLIALPLVGAFFTFYLFMSDVDRWNQEKRHLSTRFSSTSLPYPTTAACWFFAGAGIVDFVDSWIHFGIAYGYVKQLSHHTLSVLEKRSIRCAIVSTLFAVLGEIVSQRNRQRQLLQRQ